MIAGIGGASLGTEIQKCLTHAEGYEIFGCDISELAYGLYEPKFSKTFIIKRENYVKEILQISRQYDIQAIIPGGEEPLRLLARQTKDFLDKGIHIASNSQNIIELCSDKSKLFSLLQQHDISIPTTIDTDDIEKNNSITYPCIIKPSIESGGSKSVFLASNKDEASVYLKYLTKNGQKAIVQQYIPLDEGEFTVGVLSLTNGKIVGSIAMRRIFDSQLSVSIKTKNGLISSGYSQGLIDYFKKVRKEAEEIAKKIGSKGPLNIQGRFFNNHFIPFEINPRFSASTYLRTLAGFNEVDIFLRHLILGETPKINSLKTGYFLRSFTERFVNKNEAKKDSLD